MSKSPTPRVLVADDQADVVAALRLLLRSEGFDADTASSVDEVRRQLAGRVYDLLLMDLNYARDTTSGREGLDLLAEVHARDEGLPVIVMTGWGSIDTAVEAMQRGARTFVHKPWDNGALVRTIRVEIDGGIARRRADTSARRELEDAQRIQRALLPSMPLTSMLPRSGWCDVAAAWTPARTFGGDCYDVIVLDADRIGVSIGDVAGKGLPAALVMSNLQASVRAFAGEGLPPSGVAARTNRALCGNAGFERFVTFFYAVLDAVAGTLTFCNAGQNPPVLLRRDGSTERLGAGGTVLGVFDAPDYTDGIVQLSPGDRLVLFTDGITEAANAAGDDFGDGRLVERIAADRGLPPQRLVDALMGAVSAFAGNQLEDDATVVCVDFAVRR